MSEEPIGQGQEPGIGALVSRVLGIAALVVAASAALFVGLGQISDDAPLVVADAPEEPENAEPDPEPEPSEPDVAEPEEPEEPEPAPEADADDEPAREDEPDGDEPDADPGDAADEDAEEDAPDQDADEADEEPSVEEPSGDEPARIEPDTISVQVLDGFQDDGGAAADGVAAQLRDDGYRVVAQNPALRYEVTTVLWTAGNEAAGQQIARDIGAAEVREQPGNLSTSVMVHVVVGADRG